MAIVLTSAINVPNIPRAVLVAFQSFDNTAVLSWEVRNNIANRVKRFTQYVRNTADGGVSDVLRINPAPVAFDDDIIMATTISAGAITTTDAATQLENSYVGANRAARLRSVEQKCLDLGLVTLFGTVQ